MQRQGIKELGWEIGRRGEEAAVDHLRKAGFLILERNWRNGRYEIDIIAQRWDEIHFVEVKTRKAEGWTLPEQAITPHKFQSLRRAASLYMALKHCPLEPFFDLCAVESFPNGEMHVELTTDAMQSHW